MALKNDPNIKLPPAVEEVTRAHFEVALATIKKGISEMDK